MNLTLKCPACGSLSAVGRQSAGKMVACPKCGQHFVAAPPRAEPVAPREPAAEPVGDAIRVEPPPAAPPANEPPGRPRRRGPLRIAAGAAAILLLSAGVLAAVWAFKVWAAPTPPGDDNPHEAVVPPPAPGIHPLELEADRVERVLPAPVGDVAVGGAGRYLILHMPARRELAIFDVNEGRIVKSLAIAEDDIRFAAGMDKLLVVLPARNLIQRWSLTTFERELMVTLPVDGEVHTLCMGSASDGPLLVSCSPAGIPQFKVREGGILTLLDPFTLKPLPTHVGGAAGMGGTSGHLRASADGKVFGLWRRWSGPEGLHTFVLGPGGELRLCYAHESPKHVLPGPDGQTIFTGLGLFTPDLRRPGRPDDPGPGQLGVFPDRNGQTRDPRYCIPAQQGPLYLAAPAQWGEPTDGKESWLFSAYLLGRDKPLPGLPEVEVPAVKDGNPPRRNLLFTADKRVHLIPEARLVVHIPAEDDRLVLQRYDVYEALEKSGADYLFFTSQPPPPAHKGRAFVYPVATRSSKGVVKYSLKSGPQGMTISSDGEVKWAVPADFDDGEIELVVSATDAGGQKVTQKFPLRMGD